MSVPKVYEGETYDKIYNRVKFGYSNAEIIEELKLTSHRVYRTTKEIREKYGFKKPTRSKCLPSREICKSCIYVGQKSKGCDFYFWTDIPRGCEAGTGCIRYKKGTSLHRANGSCSRKRNKKDET